MIENDCHSSSPGTRYSVPHSRPSVGKEEPEWIGRVIESGQLAQGPQVRAFETEVGEFLRLPPGVAASSGTAALHLALMALGVGAGDEVLLPSYVCTSPLHAIRHAGARPVPVDVDPETGNLDPADLRKRLTSGSKAVIAVHLLGMPALMEEILACGLPVVEDCAQALGARMGTRMAGSMGTLSVCSFYATKLITTGEGGMILSPHASLLEKLRDLNDYDKKEDLIVRYNYKMSDLEAALGRCQLLKLEKFLEERQKLALIYDENLRDLPYTLPPRKEGRIYYRYVIKVSHGVQDMIEQLASWGIEAARPIFRPVHQYLGLNGYPGTEECWKTHLSLPIYPGLSSDAVEKVCAALAKAVRH